MTFARLKNAIFGTSDVNKDLEQFPDSELILNEDGSVYHLSLLPENIADTIITVGDPGRVYKISEHFDELEFEMNKREFITHTGTYKGKRITVISTGMGTDNIDIFMNEIDALANIDFTTRTEKPKKKRLTIIRIGTSGAIQPDIRLGSHLISVNAVGFDTLGAFYNLPQTEKQAQIMEALKEKLNLNFTPYTFSCSEKLLKKFSKLEIAHGNTVTAPGFYGPQGRKLRIEPKNDKFINDLLYFNEDDFVLTNMEMETSAYYMFGQLLGHDVISINAILANRISNKFSKAPQKSIDSLIKKVLDQLVAI